MNNFVLFRHLIFQKTLNQKNESQDLLLKNDIIKMVNSDLQCPICNEWLFKVILCFNFYYNLKTKFCNNNRDTYINHFDNKYIVHYSLTMQ